ncbi:MAG: Crp/Fnr family transcriptional regulator [Acidobacteriota bacterium]|nr:Crp/Fnr family transcriptional regulator [Acidobacteriota bacterium]
MSMIPEPEDAAGSSLDDKFPSLFRQHAELKDYLPETELFRQGRLISAIWLIERGIVKFTRTHSQGREMIVALRLPGKLLGAASVISHSPSAVTAATLTECRLYHLSAEVFLNLVETNTEFARYLLRTISRQFYEQSANLARLGTSPALARVAHLLLQLVPESAYKQGGEIRLELPAKHAVLAKTLAIRHEYFSRLLGKLNKMGIIRSSKGWIYVRDLKRLAQQAEE